jgi:pimeloyl-ACP methyl ester carboxylesterase
MGIIDVGGVSLFYAEKGAGQPVVFVHGIPTDYRAWSSQLDALSGRFTAIAYSRRYAYPNARQGDLLDSTVENNAADLAGMIGKLGVAPVNLVGHSYGGFVAAYLATRQPGLIRSLTLVEPAIATLLLKNQKSVAEQLSLLLTHPSVALSARRFIQKSNDPALKALERGDTSEAVRLNLDGVQDRIGVLEQLPVEQRQMMLDNGRTIKEVGTPFPILTKAELKKIKGPTLVINGETSTLWLRRVGEIAAASIPGCERARIKAGHYPHLENPTEFNKQLLDFLQRTE